MAVVTFVVLRYLSAPYGRHARKGMGSISPQPAGLDLDGDAAGPLLPLVLQLGGESRGTWCPCCSSRCGSGTMYTGPTSTLFG